MRGLLGSAFSVISVVGVLYGIKYFLQYPFRVFLMIFFSMVIIGLLHELVSWVTKITKEK